MAGDETGPTDAFDATLVRTGEDPTDRTTVDQMPSGVDLSDAVARQTTGADGSPPILAASSKQRIGPFQIIGILGSGGMGMVYRAIGPDNRPAAVKVLSSALEPQLLRRFQ